MTELLLGCGKNLTRKVQWNNKPDWDELITLDMNPDHKPDIVHDLEILPLPVDDNSFDEIHAYDVMEHVGHQGDWRFFFAQFDDLWRALKPGGVFIGVSPIPGSPWAWGDPGHTRIVGRECLVYLDRAAYTQVGETPMTDYRPYFHGDFSVLHTEYTPFGQHIYVLKAHKPMRTDDELSRAYEAAQCVAQPSNHLAERQQAVRDE